MDTLNLPMLALVCLLGSEQYPVRQASTAQLLRYGFACPGVLHAGQQNSCLEVKRRCEWIARESLRRHADWLLEDYRPRWGWWPWIDQAGNGPLTLSDAAKNRYLTMASGKGKGPYGSVWWQHEEATRLLCRDLLLEGRTEEIRVLVRMLMDGSRQWLRDNGYEVPD